MALRILMQIVGYGTRIKKNGALCAVLLITNNNHLKIIIHTNTVKCVRIVFVCGVAV